jgi:hypothetical protein
MKVKKLQSYIVKLYEAGQNNGRPTLCLLGGAGIGKSLNILEAGKEIASKLNKQFVIYSDDIAEQLLAEPDKYFVFTDFRLTECEPSDLAGIPRDVPSINATKLSPMLWARVLSKCAGILLLDELTNVQRDDVISEAYKLVFDRRAGFVEFHQDVMIIACGNTPDNSSVARLLPAPLINRLLVIKVDIPKVDEWKNFMDDHYGEDWDNRVYFFLKRFENDNYLYKPPRNPETLDPYPTPRAWTRCALYLKKGFDDLETIAGFIGEEVAHKLHAFLSLNITLEELLTNPKRYKDLSLDAKYMAIAMLSTHITKVLKNKETIFMSKKRPKEIEDILRLYDVIVEDRHEFAVLLAVSLIRGNDYKICEMFFNLLAMYNQRYLNIIDEVSQVKKLIDS